MCTRRAVRCCQYHVEKGQSQATRARVRIGFRVRVAVRVGSDPVLTFPVLTRIAAALSGCGQLLIHMRSRLINYYYYYYYY